MAEKENNIWFPSFSAVSKGVQAFRDMLREAKALDAAQQQLARSSDLTAKELAFQ